MYASWETYRLRGVLLRRLWELLWGMLIKKTRVVLTMCEIDHNFLRIKRWQSCFYSICTLLTGSVSLRLATVKKGAWNSGLWYHWQNRIRDLWDIVQKTKTKRDNEMRMKKEKRWGEMRDVCLFSYPTPLVTQWSSPDLASYYGDITNCNCCILTDFLLDRVATESGTAKCSVVLGLGYTKKWLGICSWSDYAQHSYCRYQSYCRY